MNKPFSSVLMSIYNETSDQVHESVKSILNQSFSDFEFIIIIDNPHRNDLNVLLSDFHDDRIRFYTNETNKGLALSMNKAAELAKSDLFIRMDADDVALSNRFQVELDIVNRYNVDFVFSNYNVIDEKSNLVYKMAIEEDIPDSISFRNTISLNPSMIHHPTVVFKRDVFEKTGGYRDFPCSQDSDLWMRMAENGCRFYKIGTPLLNYRKNPSSITNNRWFQQQLTGHYVYELSIQRLKKVEDDYSKENYHDYLIRWGVDDLKKQKRHRRATSILEKASIYKGEKKNLISCFLRFFVFLTSNVYRNHYIQLIRKKKLLNI